MKKKMILMEHGDKLTIEPKKKWVYFHVYCDGTGFSTRLNKEDLKELL